VLKTFSYLLYLVIVESSGKILLLFRSTILIDRMKEAFQ